MDFVKTKTDEWCHFNRFTGTVMEALEQLNHLIDESDPDSDLPNIVHAFQTAERIRQAHPQEDWFHLTGLIHDLGKVMAYHEPQWAVVGDTFPVGCAFAPSIVYRSDSFDLNPDLNDPRYKLVLTNRKLDLLVKPSDKTIWPGPKCGIRSLKLKDFFCNYST